MSVTDARNHEPISPPTAGNVGGSGGRGATSACTVAGAEAVLLAAIVSVSAMETDAEATSDVPTAVPPGTVPVKRSVVLAPTARSLRAQVATLALNVQLVPGALGVCRIAGSVICNVTPVAVKGLVRTHVDGRDHRPLGVERECRTRHDALNQLGEQGRAAVRRARSPDTSTDRWPEPLPRGVAELARRDRFRMPREGAGPVHDPSTGPCFGGILTTRVRDALETRTTDTRPRGQVGQDGKEGSATRRRYRLIGGPRP
jgi:hypothetical protein